jgi:hypothetical protein
MLLLQASLSSVAVIGCNEQSMERAYIPTRPRAKGNKKRLSPAFYHQQ